MSLRRQLAIVALVYVIEGFPVGVHNVWPVFFRRQEAPLSEIGWLSVLGFAWSFKVLWSPLIDRFGERRGWIAGCLAAMAASQLALAALAPAGLSPAIWIALAVFCLASATQDIAIDAYTIGFVDRGREGLANSVRITAYRAGLLAASGLLLLPRWIDWPATFASAAIALLALAAAVLRCPEVPVPEAARRELLPPLRRWLERGGAAAVAAFVLLYRVGDRAMGPMPAALWVDRGFSNEEIALLSTTFGMLATVAGAVCGGAVVTRIGIGRALAVLGFFALASNLGYAAAALASGKPPVVAAALVESFCGGLATAAFLSFLMRICEKEHAAVQYALLSSLALLAGTAVAGPSGQITERIGYPAFFALTALIGLPAFAFLPRASAWLGEGPLFTPASPREPRPDPPRS